MEQVETRFAFPAKLARDRESGGFTVSFRDVPEALTAGSDRADALVQAADCLDEAIAGRIVDGEAIPSPSKAKRGELVVSLPARMAAKAALYIALSESKMSRRQFASKLGCDDKEVRRMLDPRHRTKLDRLAEALAALDWRMTVSFERVAA